MSWAGKSNSVKDIEKNNPQWEKRITNKTNNSNIVSATYYE